MVGRWQWNCGGGTQILGWVKDVKIGEALEVATELAMERAMEMTVGEGRDN